ncbi:unnamed protein product [Leptidea sinapis]|uniref:Sodium/calcium exchanger membrane region domain-containing protein n=1 Tax=Leptidea sinapis TaxID=189913 RepID=A0A5E4QT09_9NEOP|nr:unnamed protein product [Leptidea sinapis]
MLLRTSKCKYRLAVLIRVLLLGLPIFHYLMFGDGAVDEGATDKATFSSRHLLTLEPEKNCTRPAILEFPPDGLSRSQRKHGFIIVHCVIALYCFLLLGAVCEQYFVPAIEIICDRLNLAADIAGATFMAAASSSPELFINCIGTFVTEGDLGVGAVVGSAVFNVLVVPACCALAASKIHFNGNEKSYGLDLTNRITVEEQRINELEEGISITSESSMSSILSWPGSKSSFMSRCLWMLTLPLSLVLWLTIPNCKKNPRLYPVTFMMCIIWIAGVSYLVAWIITIIGDTLNVPDSITGLTILAAGTSLPEAVSSVLVTNHGHGSMGISNTIGSNTFDILLCLGLPWLIKSLFYPCVPGHHWVNINSSGLSYSAISLLTTLFALYGSLALNKFQLDWKVGLTCIIVYIGFLTLAALLELNVLFEVNLPICAH